MRWLVLPLILAAMPAMAADQFDLICDFGKTPVRYRVDLAAGEVCEGDCSRIWQLGPVTSGEMTLMDTRNGTPDEVPQTIVVNRQTGALRHWIGGRGRPVTEDAMCRVAAFTGFPRSKF